MILENGVIRTMDPALPVARALAIAGDRIAGGVGTHETALPTPDRVDLGGRCVLPAFTDSHVHFPTWSLARRDVRLEGATSLAEALERVRTAPRHGPWIRGTGWRDAALSILGDCAGGLGHGAASTSRQLASRQRRRSREMNGFSANSPCQTPEF